MAGVDPLTIKEVGGWRTLAMVQRYAHLAPGHLYAAVERLVSSQQEGAVELPVTSPLAPGRSVVYRKCPLRP